MMNEKSTLRSAVNLRVFIESLSLITSARLSHTSLMSNFPPCSFLPAFTPFTIIPASVLTSLFGYLSTTVFMSFTQPLASPLFSFAIPSKKMNLSRFAPNGNRVADICTLFFTSMNLSALKASYVAAYRESSRCTP